MDPSKSVCMGCDNGAAGYNTKGNPGNHDDDCFVLEAKYEIEALRKENAELRKECEEQARLNGMGAQREAKLLTENADLKAKVDERIQKYTADDLTGYFQGCPLCRGTIIRLRENLENAVLAVRQGKELEFSLTAHNDQKTALVKKNAELKEWLAHEEAGHVEEAVYWSKEYAALQSQHAALMAAAEKIGEFCQELRDNMDKKCMCLKRSIGIGSVSVDDGGIMCLDCKLEAALAEFQKVKQ